MMSLDYVLKKTFPIACICTTCVLHDIYITTFCNHRLKSVSNIPGLRPRYARRVQVCNSSPCASGSWQRTARKRYSFSISKGSDRVSCTQLWKQSATRSAGVNSANVSLVLSSYNGCTHWHVVIHKICGLWNCQSEWKCRAQQRSFCTYICKYYGKYSSLYNVQ